MARYGAFGNYRYPLSNSVATRSPLCGGWQTPCSGKARRPTAGRGTGGRRALCARRGARPPLAGGTVPPGRSARGGRGRSRRSAPTQHQRTAADGDWVRKRWQATCEWIRQSGDRSPFPPGRRSLSAAAPRPATGASACLAARGVRRRAAPPRTVAPARSEAVGGTPWPSPASPPPCSSSRPPSCCSCRPEDVPGQGPGTLLPSASTSRPWGFPPLTARPGGSRRAAWCARPRGRAGRPRPGPGGGGPGSPGPRPRPPSSGGRRRGA